MKGLVKKFDSSIQTRVSHLICVGPGYNRARDKREGGRVRPRVLDITRTPRNWVLSGTMSSISSERCLPVSCCESTAKLEYIQVDGYSNNRVVLYPSILPQAGSILRLPLLILGTDSRAAVQGSQYRQAGR